MSETSTPIVKRRNATKNGNNGSSKKTKVDNWQYPVSVESLGVTFSRADSAPQLILSKDQLTVIGEKGYRMARGCVGVSEGCYYWECEILKPEKPDGHYRIGWTQAQGCMQAPVGYDRWSFAYRDVNGSKVHQSLRQDNYGEPYGPGDVIGCLIYLPTKKSAEISSENVPTANDLPEAPPLPETSFIQFFKNGLDQGVAFDCIPEGTYYPAVSLYSGAKITANFGPQFIFKPKVPLVSYKSLRLLKHMDSDEKQTQTRAIYEKRYQYGLLTAQQFEIKLQGMVKQRNQPTRLKK